MEQPDHVTTWLDIIRDYTPVLTVLFSGVIAWFLRRLTSGQKDMKAAAETAAVAATDSHAATARVEHAVNGQSEALRAEIRELKAQLATLHAAVGHRRRGDRPIDERRQDAPDPATPAGDER